MRSALVARESKPRPWDGPTDGYFLTNRCGNAKSPGCGRALTKLEILDSMGVNPKRKTICPCGSQGFRSSNFKLFEELLLVRSWKLWWAIRKGVIPPPPSKGEVAEANQVMMAGLIQSIEGDMPGEDMDLAALGTDS